MSIPLSQLVVPPMVRALEALSATLEKAEAHAAALKVADSVFLQARLYPDMYPMVRQVQIACDFAKGAVARLSGVEVPSWADEEASFPDLRARVGRTLDYVRAASTEALDAGDDRAVSLSAGARVLEFRGADYLIGFVLPNFYFHLATAYGLLRHNGVPIGKRDFIGSLPLR